MAKKTKLSDLRTQRQNANKHTDRGIKALDKAIVENGWIGAATIAANGETFDGSARLEVLKKRFGDDIDPIIVDCDGTRPVFVRRTDIADTDDPKAQLLSVQANRIAQIDLDWNPDVLADIAKRVKLSSVFEEEELTFIMSKEQRASLVAGLKDKWESEGVEGDDEVADTLQDDDSGYSDDDDIDDEELGDRTEIKHLGGDRVENEYSGDRAINGKPIESEQEKAERLAKDAELLASEAESTIEILEQIETIQSRVKLGDIWALGRHRICCGDSTVEANVRALLAGEKCQMCWTDPPYNVDYDPEARVSSFSKERLANPIGKIANDSMSDDNFFEFLINAYKGIDLALSEGSPIYISHADTMGHHFRNAFVAMPWKLQSCLIWEKTVLVFGRADYHWMHEPILYGWKKGAGHRYFGDRKQTTILRFPSPHYDKKNCDTEGYVHSCQKPTPLIQYCLENSTEFGDKIYEPFLGSGATIIAAEKMERDLAVYGCELSLDYCEVIIRRWEKFTGQTATLIGTL